MIDEKQYQLGIRQLSPQQMIEVICGYRNELKECLMLLVDLQKSSELTAIQKMICEQNVHRLSLVINDFRTVVETDMELVIEEEE